MHKKLKSNKSTNRIHLKHSPVVTLCDRCTNVWVWSIVVQNIGLVTAGPSSMPSENTACEVILQTLLYITYGELQYREKGIVLVSHSLMAYTYTVYPFHRDTNPQQHGASMWKYNIPYIVSGVGR